MAAFVLSLAHNNRVEASIDNKDYFSYLMIEDSINQNIEDSQDINEESVGSIKAMFDIVDKLVKHKNVVKEVALQSGDTLISLLSRLGVSRDEANDIYYSLKEHYDPRGLKAGQKLKDRLKHKKIITFLDVPEGKDLNDLSFEEFKNLKEYY